MDLVPIKLTWPVQPGALATDSWWRVASQMKVGLPHRTCVAQVRQAAILCVAFLIIFFWHVDIWNGLHAFLIWNVELARANDSGVSRNNSMQFV